MTAAPEAPAQPEGIIKHTDVRLADLGEIRAQLLRQRARRLDVVVNRRMIASEGGRLLVQAGEATTLLTDDGPVSVAGLYGPTNTWIETLGKMLNLDISFLKRLYGETPVRTDMIDALINARLHGNVNGDIPDGSIGFGPQFAPHAGSMMLRLLRPDDSDDGTARAMVSPRFRTDMDNYDVAEAVLRGIAQAGVQALPDVCSLTERKMTLRFAVPQIAALAPNLLKGYHSPLDGPGGVPRAGMDRPGMRLRAEANWGNWTVPQALLAAAREGMGYAPGTEPVVFAGLIVTNGDTGGAARFIAPVIKVQVCKNGLTLMAEADRRTHLGSTQSEGVVQYAADTMDAELALITKQARDAVVQYLNPDWFREQVAEIEDLAGVSLRDEETAQAVIRDVTKAARFTGTETDGVWDMFTRSGAVPVVGSVGNAITAYSQTIANADRAVELDALAIPLMREAAKAAPKTRVQAGA